MALNDDLGGKFEEASVNVLFWHLPVAVKENH